ncbi:MAG: Hsp33 family molecular chaperone HslO [Armatimonadetes bacterium]|nr:Hsp33 family molecular chaperone HslO [Armatimonadota bacterium]MDW8153424.1 Hsp33 family molecular chaperone HslO [Armatimonadota bacterium]
MDTLVRALGAEGSVRAFACVTTELVEEARVRHGTAPTATAALGRALTASGLLAGTLKRGQKVTLRILGDGPLGGILADGTAEGAVRGYVQNPHVHLPLRRPRKLDVGTAVGRGVLHVTRDLGLRYPYHGAAPLVSGEIGEDLAYYFAQSEQIPSVVALGVLVEAQGHVAAAGGFLVQVLPGTREEILAYLDAHSRTLPPVTALVWRGLRPVEILQVALGDLPFRVLEERPLRFQCTCSVKRVREVLTSLGPRELGALLREQGRAEVRCRFCGEHYLLEGPALHDLLRGFV